MERVFTYLIFFSCLMSTLLHGYPQYYCTAACKDYYERVLHLIGSIHRYNFEHLVEIAVFDLGLTEDQISNLQKIAKVKVYFTIKELYPHMLSRETPQGAPKDMGWERKPGWYAWKPVAINTVMETFPYVLWIDAGCFVQRPLDELFAYIDERGYFLATIGDDLYNDRFFIDKDGKRRQVPIHPLRWGTCKFVIDTFQLEDPENKWMLDQEFVMATFLGVAKKSKHLFLDEWYKLTQDMRYFAEDGSTPEGWGCGRHDQTLLTIIAFKNKLHIYPLDAVVGSPIFLETSTSVFPFYTNWRHSLVSKHTHIVMRNIVNHKDNIAAIRYRVDI